MQYPFNPLKGGRMTSIAVDVVDAHWRILQGEEKAPTRGVRMLRCNRRRASSDGCDKHEQLEKKSGVPKREGSRFPIIDRIVRDELKHERAAIRAKQADIDRRLRRRAARRRRSRVHSISVDPVNITRCVDEVTQQAQRESRLLGDPVLFENRVSELVEEGLPYDTAVLVATYDREEFEHIAV